MNILAFDTSTENLSVGLKTDKTFSEINRSNSLKHSENLTTDIQTLLTDAELKFSDLDLMVCSLGPGSFTGLRIGMSTAKGLAAGGKVPFVAVSLLDAIAYRHRYFNGITVPLIDARKSNFYTALFRNSVKTSEYYDKDAESILKICSINENILFCGPGAGIFHGRISEKYKTPDDGLMFDLDYEPGISSAMIECGIRKFNEYGAEAENVGPMYIRLSDAEILSKS